MTAGDTFPNLLLQNAERLGDRAALREKGSDARSWPLTPQKATVCAS
jgi:hypothetical protein